MSATNTPETPRFHGENSPNIRAANERIARAGEQGASVPDRDEAERRAFAEQEKKQEKGKSGLEFLEEAENNADQAKTSNEGNILSIITYARAVADIGRFAAKNSHVDWLEDKNNKKNEYGDAIKLIDDLLSNPTQLDHDQNKLTQLRNAVKFLAGHMKEYVRDESKEKGLELEFNRKIKSIKELAKLIMEGADKKFKPGGKKEIIDTSNKFHPENFDAWLRAEMVQLRTDISPNEAINLFGGGITVSTPWRNINFLEVYKQQQYWNDEEEVVDRVATEAEAERTRNLVAKENSGVPLTKDDLKMIVTDKDGVRITKAGEIISHKKIYKETEAFNNLKKNETNLIYLFGSAHNFDVDMRNNLGAEAEIPTALKKHSNNNVFTQSRTRLLYLLKLNGTSDDSEIKQVLESGEMLVPGSVGKAFRRALLAYYYLGEIDSDQEDNMFEKMLGEEGLDAFYKAVASKVIEEKLNTRLKQSKRMEATKVEDKQRHDVEILMDIVKMGKENDTDWLREIVTISTTRDMLLKALQDVGSKDLTHDDLDIQKFSNSKDYASRLLNKVQKLGVQGKFTEDELKKYDNDPIKIQVARDKKALAVLNFFNQRNAKDPDIKLVKVGMNAALKKTEGLDADDASFAETLTSSFWYSMAMGARNDLNGTGFDAWSKIINFSRYRAKQGEGRIYPGNVYNMFGLKRLGLTPFEAWQVTQDDGLKMTLLNWLQGGQGSTVDLKKEFKEFDFKGDAMRQYTNDHVGNAYKVYTWLIEQDNNWGDLFKWEKGVLKFKLKDAHSIMDDNYHWIRYAFDNFGFDYKSKIRSIEYDIDKQDDGSLEITPRFVEESILDSMFDEEVQSMGMYERAQFADDKDKKVQRNVFAYILAKEIYAHTKWDSPKEHWSDEQIALLQDFFLKLSAGGFYKDDHGHIKSASPFFNWNELGIIKEHGARGTVYKIKTIGGQLLVLPIEILLGSLHAGAKVAIPKGLEANIGGLEAVFGRVAF